MTTKTKALRVVDHPELGQLELLSEVICRAAVLPAESRHPRDYQVLERPVLHKLQGLALPRPDGRMALTRALLRDRWRIEVCEQHWRWLNPEAKGRKDRWHEARCAHYVHARTEKRPQVPHFQAQTLWARPDVDLIWSGEPAQPQPPVSPCFYRIVRGDDLWSLLSDIRFKPGTETQARQLVNQLADNFNRQEFASLLLRIRPAATFPRF